MIELWVYGDESGIERHDPYCAVSGFIASPRQWDRFNEAWRRIVREAGISEFHATHFFGRHSARRSLKNEFADWTDKRADDFLDALLGVLRDFKERVRPIGALMDNQVFFSYSWGERNFLTGAQWDHTKLKFVSSGAPSRAYHFPFFTLIGSALEYANPADCKVHFRMDESKVVRGGIQQLFIRSREQAWTANNDLRLKLGDLHPGSSQDHEGIQAADLLAHISATTYAKNMNGAGLSKDRQRALDSLYGIWGDAADPGVIGTRGLNYVLDEHLSPEELELIRGLPSPAEKQQARHAENRGSSQRD